MNLCLKCTNHRNKVLLVFVIFLFCSQQVWNYHFFGKNNSKTPTKLILHSNSPLLNIKESTALKSNENRESKKGEIIRAANNTKSKQMNLKSSYKFKSVYMEETAMKRPLFTFLSRPWKAEASIRNGISCRNKSEIHWSMVFVIKSSIRNIDRRNAIRNTWGKVKVFGNAQFQAVFVLGISPDKSLRQNVTNENITNGDILQFNQTDEAASVPEKVLAGMQWASDLPPDWLYASIDDDIVINYARLHQYYEHLVNKSRLTASNAKAGFSSLPIVCVYSYQDKDEPARNKKSKWYMPKEKFGGKYWPIYCRGGMYTTSSDMVKNLYEVSRRTPRLYLDDVWITGFMRLKVQNTDENILAAPGSRLSEKILQSDKWDVSSIVYHMWGNTITKPTDVVSGLTKAWSSILRTFLHHIIC